jgi:hypothetical protein
MAFSSSEYGSSGATVPNATRYLRTGALAALMPTVVRLMALQKDCATALPDMFSQCDIVRFHAGELVFSTPNSAFTAKLRQQVPGVIAQLQARGWGVQTIGLKVKVEKSIAPEILTHALALPGAAMTALTDLSDALPASVRNQRLINALRTLVQHHRAP